MDFDQLKDYKRIAIIGRPGSGKSTFAKKLSKQLNLPLYHLDKYFFQANWQERPQEDFLEDYKKILSEDAWVMDGNCLRHIQGRIDHADCIILFSRPRLLCLYRIIKRRFFKDASILDRPQSCPEKLTWKLIHYMWAFDERLKRKIPSFCDFFYDF